MRILSYASLVVGQAGMTITATGQVGEGDRSSPYSLLSVIWDRSSLSPMSDLPIATPPWNCQVLAEPEKGIEAWDPASTDLTLGKGDVDQMVKLLEELRQSLPSEPEAIVSSISSKIFYRTVKAVEGDVREIHSNSGIYLKGETKALREYRLGSLEKALERLDKLHHSHTAVTIKDEDLDEDGTGSASATADGAIGGASDITLLEQQINRLPPDLRESLFRRLMPSKGEHDAPSPSLFGSQSLPTGDPSPTLFWLA